MGDCLLQVCFGEGFYTAQATKEIETIESCYQRAARLQKETCTKEIDEETSRILSSK